VSHEIHLSLDRFHRYIFLQKHTETLNYFISHLLHELIFAAVSYNQPKFCANATWNPNATTLADSSIVGTNPFGIFVDTSNTISVAALSMNSVQVWFNESIYPSKTLSGGLSTPYALFVSTTGDIYVDNGASNGRVDKWTRNGSTSVPVMYVGGACYGLFIDVNNTLYCSIPSQHQIVTKSLNNDLNTITIVAGTGCSGNTPNMLSSPYKIFVNINFDLYVADTLNNRIQLFKTGQLNATTVAGTGAPATISLNEPTGVVLVADEYLFIADNSNHRVIGSDVNGFRCIVGCSGPGSASNQLHYPQSLSFDTYGNIFVTDQVNNRIQKFDLSTNTCGKKIVIKIISFY
jgi:hypothetical protein